MLESTYNVIRSLLYSRLHMYTLTCISVHCILYFSVHTHVQYVHKRLIVFIGEAISLVVTVQSVPTCLDGFTKPDVVMCVPVP